MIRLFLLVVTLVMCSISANAQTSVFNNGWKYRQGDFSQAKETKYDDSEWENIGLPHSFSIPYFMGRTFYTGYGWYRKNFDVNSSDLKKLSYLEFDGVFQEAEIFVNGSFAGKHRGGYTGFRIDMTPYLKVGKNLVAVRVNNLWNATLAPRAGEHVFSGGIYRSVRLVKKNNVHFDWCGICITTPRLEETQGKDATTLFKCDIKNAKKASDLTLDITLLDADKNVVGRGRTNATPSSFTVKPEKVNLWTPATPNLYTAVCRLYDGKKLLDEETIEYGYRWFKWTADKGFFINGEHLYFRGANVHQDQAGWGDAVTEEAARRDVRMVKEAGFDMIRGSHYPHSPAFVSECNRQGLLFWSEAPFWGTYGQYHDGNWQANPYPLDMKDSVEFEKTLLQQLDEMILIHRNSPAVFAWSMCNEVFFSTNSTKQQIRNMLRKMVDRTHQLDPTRKVGIGGCQRPIDEDRLDGIGDIAGYNGDGAAIPNFLNPGFPNVVTEYSTTTADRPGKYDPGWGDLAKNDMWKGVEWRSGQSIWCAFDHGSIFGEEMAKMGIIDYFRIPKRAWYWYRNEFAHVAPPQWPVDGKAAKLVIEASKQNKIKADGTDDTWLLVKVVDKDGRELTSTPDVHLFVKKGPGLFPTGRSIDFKKDSEIRILDGKAAISFRSYYNGNTIIEASSPGLESGTIALNFVEGEKYKGDSQYSANGVKKEQNVASDMESKTSVFGILSPTFVSSSLLEHQAGGATDDNVETYWEASPNDSKPYITLDTERTITLEEVNIIFKEESSKKVLVECSTDNSKWNVLADYRSTPQKGKDLNFKLTRSQRSRFVRISFFEGSLPAVSDFKVKGKL